MGKKSNSRKKSQLFSKKWEAEIWVASTALLTLLAIMMANQIGK